MLPWEARAAFANGSMPRFDAVVSFSSVEHTVPRALVHPHPGGASAAHARRARAAQGLGRYGDALNPWGDLQTAPPPPPSLLLPLPVSLLYTHSPDGLPPPPYCCPYPCPYCTLPPSLQVARAWCVTRPGGELLLGAPTGADALMWNAHRQYGPVRVRLVRGEGRGVSD